MRGLTVWCMNTNNHAPQEEVDILQDMVERNLSIPHEFVCITESDLPGWWGKVRLFDGRANRRNLWLDLDTVITGPLDGLLTPVDADIRIIKNWALSGYGGCQSSVIYWEGMKGRVISDAFDPGIAHWPPRNDNGALWGDQEWMTELRDEGSLKVEYFSADDIVCYKYHCRGKVAFEPKGIKIVVFHGKPKPSEVRDPWVVEARCLSQSTAIPA